MNYKNYLWPLPFFTFVGAYLILNLFEQQPTRIVPHVVGKTILQATTQLSAEKLGLRIIGTKIDNDLPDGTIISQQPSAQQAVRTGQTVLCVISQHPPQEVAADYRGLSREMIAQELTKKGYQQKYVYLKSAAPHDQCVGQFPHPGKSLDQRTMTLYLAEQQEQLVIMPDCTGLFVENAERFFADRNLTTNIVHNNLIDDHHTCNRCTIIEQRPLAGSIIDLAGNQVIQLYVE